TYTTELHRYRRFYFPTRRSSDLPHSACSTTISTVNQGDKSMISCGANSQTGTSRLVSIRFIQATQIRKRVLSAFWCRCWIHASRSEEHTSELQSRENILCRLLLA